LKKITSFLEKNNYCFYLAAVSPNTNKVGALFIVTLAILNEIILLTDFDTDIVGLDKLSSGDNLLNWDQTLMGCYFRMLPHGGRGNLFLYQQVEYTMARNMYQLHKKEGSVTVMPGAGSCYRRIVLTEIYHQHSGLRNGEDREATLIGQRLGYKAFYLDDVFSLTRPPLSFRALVKQRIRWNLGYLETFHKEQHYYLKQIRRFSRIGIRTLADICNVTFIALLPFLALAFAITHFYFSLLLCLGLYLITVIWCLNILSIRSAESREFKSTFWIGVLVFPVFKISVECCAWSRAIVRFINSTYLKKK
jgi:cellulose synthase/poly-beta-1,6-N-acetylglucosamine synthase-like glycosyltransferase